MTSWAPGTALRMVLRTRPSTPRTAAGCEAMYSSTDLKSGLAITDSSLLARIQSLSTMKERQRTRVDRAVQYSFAFFLRLRICIGKGKDIVTLRLRFTLFGDDSVRVAAR